MAVVTLVSGVESTKNGGYRVTLVGSDREVLTVREFHAHDVLSHTDRANQTVADYARIFYGTEANAVAILDRVGEFEPCGWKIETE